ncbi:MAG TPA: ABC transporter substrate-binding protein [Acidimicrobiales bacterium]|nr:ABC transporter substrate-binding protein [Acidimicrobiales bacterium]
MSRGVPTVVATAGLSLVAAACGSSSGGSANATPAGASVSANQTVVLATQGLGSEGDATKAAIAGFEKAHPNIKVDILTLSPTADNARQQLTQRFVAGSSTPDVITADVIWPPAFAKAGWLAPLDSFNPDDSKFFAGQVATGKYNGHTYAVPWFINAEGVYYRTDLVPTPPTTPGQLVADAKSAVAKGGSIKYGLAFEGDKYEGVVTNFVNFLGAFGGKLDPSKLNTPQNQNALQFMHDLIYKDGVAPQAVTGWQESNVQDAWLSGQAAFAVNWPYLFQLSEKAGSSVAGKTGWIPFPSSAGQPAAALGGDDLAINAKSQHKAAAWALIQYLTSDAVQIQRAISAGDPPAVQSAYNNSLFSQAAYYKQEEAVFKYATPRPVVANYPQISDQLQTMLSAVLTNLSTPAKALQQTASQLGSGQAGY